MGRERWSRRAVFGAAVVLLAGGFFLAGNPARGSGGTGAPPLAGELLAGRTIIIDPGHGGYDPGALGKSYREDKINLAMALALKQWFVQAGAHVLMTWSKPSDIPSHRKYRVQERMQWINHSAGDVLIDIHCNSGHPSYRGPQTFYWDGAASYHLAHDVQEELQYFTHTVRQVTRIDQYVLRHARMPAINVEVGFITNPQEEAKLANPAYQKELTWYIFLGTERWFIRGRWPPTLLKAPPPSHLLVR